MTSLRFWSASLFALAAANPLAYIGYEEGNAAIVPREYDFGPVPDRSKPDEFCKDIDWSNKEQVQWVWDKWDISNTLDSSLYNDAFGSGMTDWLIHAANDVWGNVGKTEAEGCYTRGDTCLANTALDCRKMVSGELFSEWYYIFKAVQGLHDIMEVAHNQLTDEVMKSSLAVSSIVADFSVNEEPNLEASIMGYVASAIGVFAATASFANPGYQVAAGLLGGAAAIGSRAATETPAVIDTSSFDTSISTALDVWRSALDKTLEAALGAGSDEDIHAIVPEWEEFVSPGPWMTPIGAFFRAGRFLVEPWPLNEEPGPGELVSGAFDLLRKGLVDDALGRAGYAILGVKHTDPDRCYSDHAYGHQWISEIPPEYSGGDKGRCVGIYRFEKTVLKEDYVAAPASVYDNMQNKYGINIYDYMLASYRCATRGEGVPDVPDPVLARENGKLPLCFYRTHCEDSYYDQNVNARVTQPWVL